MLPRKSLNLLAVAVLASLASGCASNAANTAAQDSKPGGNGQGSATAAQTAAGSTSLAVNVGYAQDLRDYSNTVVVPTAYVKFLVDGKVYIGDEDGDVVVMAHGKEKVVISEVNMGSAVYGTIVPANGTLFLNNRSQLFAIAATK